MNPVPVPVPRSAPWISWGAVIAGSVVTVALQIGLTQLAVGSGLSFFQPADPSSNGGAVAAGTVIAWVVAGLISVFAGAWVAGRMRPFSSRTESGVHGALVWSTWALAGLLFAALSVGMLAGGAVSLLGQSVSAAGNVAAGAAGAVGEAGGAIAGVAAPSWDQIKEQVEGAFSRSDSSEASAGASRGSETAAPSDDRFAERSRLMQLLGNTFSVDGAKPSKADQQELNTLVASQLGIPPEAAKKTTEQWQSAWSDAVARYDAAKEEAKQTALEAATVAKNRTAQAALIAFGVMLVGLIAAVLGSLVGNHRVRALVHTEEFVPDRARHAFP